MVLATAALAVHELNAIAAAGNYLKAAQVHGDFAHRVESVSLGRVQQQCAHGASLAVACRAAVFCAWAAGRKRRYFWSVCSGSRFHTGTMPALC